MKNVIIKVPGSNRHWAIIGVKKKRILEGRMNTRPNGVGVQLMSGYWYDGDFKTVEPYGKIFTPRSGRIVGRVVAPLIGRTARKLLR